MLLIFTNLIRLYSSVSFYILQMAKVYEKITSNWLTIIDPEERVILNKFALLGKYKSFGYLGT